MALVWWQMAVCLEGNPAGGGRGVAGLSFDVFLPPPPQPPPHPIPWDFLLSEGQGMSGTEKGRGYFPNNWKGKG